MILTPLQILPKNVEDLGKLIVAEGLKKLRKFQKSAQSGHTACGYNPFFLNMGHSRSLFRPFYSIFSFNNTN